MKVELEKVEEVVRDICHEMYADRIMKKLKPYEPKDKEVYAFRNMGDTCSWLHTQWKGSPKSNPDVERRPLTNEEKGIKS